MNFFRSCKADPRCNRTVSIRGWSVRARSIKKMHVRNFCRATKTTWAVLLLTFVFVASSRAQSTFGSIVGTVQDATEAVVPGAAVTLHSEDDNSDRVTTSSATGDFQFVNLKPGRYSVAARFAGFADAQVAAFDLAPRQTARVNVVMALQNQQQTRPHSMLRKTMHRSCSCP
jgi:Carboxypeptidase regulatory-like domain